MGLDLTEVLLAVEDKFKIENFIDAIERQTALAPHSEEEADW